MITQCLGISSPSSEGPKKGGGGPGASAASARSGGGSGSHGQCRKPGRISRWCDIRFSRRGPRYLLSQRRRSGKRGSWPSEARSEGVEHGRSHAARFLRPVFSRRLCGRPPSPLQKLAGLASSSEERSSSHLTPISAPSELGEEIFRPTTSGRTVALPSRATDILVRPFLELSVRTEV